LKKKNKWDRREKDCKKSMIPSTAHVYRNVQNGGNLLKLIEGLEAFEGETFADKVESFMRSIGVTAEEIASIRNIFLKE
jgi:hypothetical protein